jgi:hypothetical protein
MIQRLDPTIPVVCPRGKGRAFMLIDYSEDHHLMWVIALDDTGEIWTYANPKVRVQSNETLDTKLPNEP